MRIILDLDEVLVDWVGGVARLWEIPPELLYACWPAGEYGVTAPLSRALGMPTDSPLTDQAFWLHLQGREDFWTNLEPLPWMDDLLDLVKIATPHWMIVTAPSWCPSSYAGKVKWFKRTFGKTFSRFAITPHKEMFARPDTILIDDSADNLRAFRAAPAHGSGILFPRHHNALHSHKDAPMALVGVTLKHMVYDAQPRRRRPTALEFGGTYTPDGDR